MNEEDKIKVGDIVDVLCVRGELTYNATVLHVPQATGESWVFRTFENGNILYVSEGITVIKRKP